MNTEKKFDALCLGQFCIDVIIGGADLEEFSKTKNEGTSAECVLLSVGGDSANEAMGLAHLGKKAGVIAEVQDDRGGRFIIDYIRETGVDVSNVGLVTPGPIPTTPNLVFVEPDGQRKFLGMFGAFGNVGDRKFTFDESVVEQTKVLSFATIGGYPMRGDEGVEFVTRIAKRAKSAGAVICADLGSFMWNPDPVKYKEMYSLFDYIFPNEGEAMAITGKCTVEKAADAFLEAGVGCVVIKVGAKGSYIKTKDGRVIETPGFRALKAIDTTGAGDNFAAGFIAAIAEGQDLESCARFANATACIACSTYGANSGVKSRQQVQDLLDSHK